MPEYELETGSKYLAFVFEDALFRRKSCVTAIPIEAKAREVRIQARKVRSVGKGVHVRGVYVDLSR
jgi:hypothetical protein